MFSRTAEYALRAMSVLTLSVGELVPTPVIARRTQVPANYLAKVLQQLAGAGLIIGRRGVRGGYKLARAASDVKLIQIINAVDPVERIKSCPLGLKTHGANLCPLHRISDKAAAAVIEIFDDVSLEDLVTESGSNRPLCETDPSAVLTVSAKRGS